MNSAGKLWEKPDANAKYMIAGWHQWADAGSISSGLPQYLIEHTGARKIGEIAPDDFYLFQLPGTHHFLRPEINLEDGYPVSLATKKNELFYTGDDQRGLVIFLGDEPHMNVARYADAFLDMVEALDVQRVAIVGGVYGAMPYDKDREISCAYSLREMKTELAEYAVKFSNYEGGTTIGSYLLKQAERRGIEIFVFYAFVPAYDLSELSSTLQGLRIENDYKAWYDVLRRFNHMFDLGLDLSDLERHSASLTESMAAKIEELSAKMPQLKIREHLDTLTRHFTERSFMPLDDVWERELGDLLEDLED